MLKRTLCLLLSGLSLCMVLFTGCVKDEGDSIEDYRGEVYAVAETGNATKSIYYRFDDDRWIKYDKSELVPGAGETIPNIPEIEFGGIKYTNRSGREHEVEFISSISDDLYFEYKANVPGAILDMKLLKDTYEPIHIVNETLQSTLEMNPKKPVDIETAKGMALEYIQEDLVGKYEKDIDINDYELLLSEKVLYHSAGGPYYYQFLWVREINGIVVHQIAISTALSGDVYECVAGKIPPEEILADLPDLTADEYTELAKEMVTAAYENADNEVEISDFALDGKYVGCDNPTIKYSHAIEKYVVYFRVTWKAKTDSDSEAEDCQQCFCIPIE